MFWGVEDIYDDMKKTFFILLTLLTWQVGRAQLVINEIMQSNIDCIMDDLNEFPDSWVELYNSSEEPVNLKDYRIGDSEKADEAWQLPNKTVNGLGYALIYCDKEGKNLHTDFRLESGKGGMVYLFKGGTVVDQLTGIKKQPAPNIAYGRKNDGSDKWGYMERPTPGSANCGSTCKDILGEPVFSETGKVLTNKQTITLSISLPEGAPSNAEIRVTTNGSEPTRTSFLYTGSLSFDTTTIVKAKVFCDGYLSPRATAHSYIFFPRKLTLPVVSIITDNQYLNDEKIGIYVDGSYQNDKKNYEFDWRRPINLEFFEGKEEKSVINQLCETRIMGGASRGSMFKSLAVYANKRFGEKRLKYEFFPDQRPEIDDFKSISLRNAGNDFDYLFMRDAIIQLTMAKHVDLDWQAWRPTIVYINGQYKGMLNIRERSNEDNVYTNFNGLEDIDMFENWNELKEGDWENYNKFKAFYAEKGHTLEEYAKWIDWEEFINLMLMNLYYNNQDFPGNNIVMWRPRTEDGRWRFIAKDTDFGLGLYNSPADYNTIEWLYNPNYDANRNWANQYDHTRLFRRMMDDADFNREFIDRAAIYMGDFMNEKGTRKVWDPMYEIIKEEYPHHRNLVNKWWPKYDEELNTARNWLKNRTNHFYTQLKNYYKLGYAVPMTIVKEGGQSANDAIKIAFNGITLSEEEFDGKFFAGREVNLQGLGEGDVNIVKWVITQTDKNGFTTSKETEGASCTFTMPDCNRIAVNAYIGSANGISTITSHTWQWQYSDNKVIVSNTDVGTSVSLYNLQGIRLWRATSNGADVALPANGKQPYILQVGDERIKISL